MSETTGGYHERPGRHPAVAATWSYVAAAPSTALVAADGCFDLLLRARSSGAVAISVYTPIGRALRSTMTSGERVVGVRLRPGFGAALRDHLALARAARHLSAYDLDGLESLVIAAVEDHGRPPRIVADFVAAARAYQGGIRLTNVTSARARELQRASQRWLGLSPKTFLRIERAWAARAAIRAGVPLAAVAGDLRYADQAHLSRELRVLLGCTPRALRSVENLQDAAPPAR